MAPISLIEDMTAWQVNILSTVLIVLTTCTIAARAYTRLFVTKKPTVDDAFIFCSWAAFMAQIGCTWAAIGPFTLLVGGDKSQAAQAIHLVNSSAVLYICSMIFMKLSLILFLLRYFQSTTTQRYILYALLTFTILFALVEFLMAVSTCVLSAYFFPPSTAAASCAIYPAYRNINRAWGISNMATDLAFPLLAINAIRHARLRRATRLMALTVVALGFLACGAAALRVAALIGTTAAASLPRSLASAFWTQLELGLGIACANAATLWPLVRAVRRRRANTESAILPPLRRRGGGRLALESERMEPVPTTQVSVLDGRPSILWRLRSAMGSEKGWPSVRDWRDDRIDIDEEMLGDGRAGLGLVLAGKAKSGGAARSAVISVQEVEGSSSTPGSSKHHSASSRHVPERPAVAHVKSGRSGRSYGS